MKAKNSVALCAILILLGASTVYAADKHGHDEKEDVKEESHAEGDSDHGEEGEEDGHGHGGEKKSDAELSNEQVKMANIVVTEIRPRELDYLVHAPGEIKSNGYSSYRVSARIPSIVLRRHVTLGETVEQDQKLVTLFSDEVAEAQADYREAASEWQRVKTLGRQAVGDKRYVSAQGDMEASLGKLEAYGLTASDIQALESGAKIKLGEYSLRAEAKGVVLSDDFHQGQRVDAGETIMDLADETELWVEARLPPGPAVNVPVGTQALIKTSGETFTAQVTQEAHKIDPRSRTRVVRLVVDNSHHKLHSGLFADVAFQFTTPKPVMALPESAVLRGADGDWQVLVEVAPGRYEPREVTLEQTLGENLIIRGIESGSRVVTSGAFFVQSEIAKSGFEVHNH